MKDATQDLGIKDSKIPLEYVPGRLKILSSTPQIYYYDMFLFPSEINTLQIYLEKANSSNMMANITDKHVLHLFQIIQNRIFAETKVTKK